MVDNNILDKLKKATAGNLIDSFILSSNTTVKFTPLNVKQQKEIIKTAMDGILSPISFSIIVNEIIKNNASALQNFLVADKPLVMLNLRKHSVGDNITLARGDKKIETTITEIINRYKPNIDLNACHKTIQEGNIQVTTKLPSLEEDTKINIEVKKLFEQYKDEEKIREIIGELFVVEVLKYINTITFKIYNEENKITFSDLTLEQKAKAFESLPMSINNKIIEVITMIRNEEKRLLEVVDGQDTYSIILDSGFFFKE